LEGGEEQAFFLSLIAAIPLFHVLPRDGAILHTIVFMIHFASLHNTRSPKPGLPPRTPLILASASPRRRELLTAAGYQIEVIPTDAPESSAAWLTARELVLLNARRKAAAAQAFRPGAALIIAADTLVSLDGESLGKPPDLESAARMLRRLAGRMHQVYTGVTLAGPGKTLCFAGLSHVQFLPLTDGQIAEYHRLINPLDKAGSYSAQEHPDKLIASIEGSLSNVLGLPMEQLTDTLAREFQIQP
jgi:septum formation protein